MISSEVIRGLFGYTEDDFLLNSHALSGGLYWLNPTNRNIGRKRHFGVTLAGYWNQRKGGAFYGRVNVENKLYYIHRLVWSFHNGDLSDEVEIDHIDVNTLNSKIGNLRVVNRNDNAKNRKSYANSSSNYVGVSLAKRGRWRARYMLDGKEHFVGEYSCEKQAALARDEAVSLAFGEFAYLNFGSERLFRDEDLI